MNKFNISNTMSQLKSFYKPFSLTEATKILKTDLSSAPLAGGTFLSLHIPKKINTLVDLSNLKLDYVKKSGDSLAIGAMSTFAKIADSKIFPALSEITANTATEQLRNMITAGGDVMIPLRWSDLPLVLFVLE
ncbi:MAG: FAD binding domain-containing protein, partial [Victivallaceae bacterium]|nr:FAD binding domain-containing protein [Victivallaceae bacterium]